MVDATCPVMPDVEEHRMLRALVYEGAVMSHGGPYVARFHGWLVQVSRSGCCRAGCTAWMTVETRCRHGRLLARTRLSICDCGEGEAGYTCASSIVQHEARAELERDGPDGCNTI